MVVDESNAIGTTFLRAQTLREPLRSRSLDLLTDYTESVIALSSEVPGSEAQEATVAEEQVLHRELWALAGRALVDDPIASAPRLYVETLNEMIDSQTTRVAALNNQVPSAVLYLELLGASVALALLAAHLTLIGRSTTGVVAASLLVGFLLFLTADLDRPTRGLIQVPDTALVQQLESMEAPPAAEGPPREGSGSRPD